MTNRQLFFNHLAQTSLSPPAIEIKSAKGIYLYGMDGKKYLDLISGIAVSNLGHGNPKIASAIKKQLGKHTHLNVYGEYIVSPQVQYAKELLNYLPRKLNNIFFVNSGSEAIEGALKLAKRSTGRAEIIAFRNAYHGSTQGTLSVMGDEKLKIPFRPLLPDIRFLEFNNENDLKQISFKTACVIVEPIQGEAGVILPKEIKGWKDGRMEGWKKRKSKMKNYLQLLRERCNQTGTLLIFDEIQTGMGRTGKLFAFEKYHAVPDILCLAKAFGGGMPLGAFVSSKEIMSTLSHHPALGHITTFGGHPLSCAAGRIALKEIVSKKLHLYSAQKGKLFKKYLIHPKIREVRGEGLLLAVQFTSEEENKKIISRCIKNGVLADWFLFCPSAMRLAPPLTITKDEINRACEIIIKSINEG